jgi:two-component system response regulator HydG
VEIEDLPEEIREVSTPAKTVPSTAGERAPVRPLAEIEREYILAALEHNGGNQTHTAAQLEIGSATLYRRLKAYGLVGKSQDE